ncbi:MAG TPA: hypothetical protein VIX59_08985 [Candidatus Binataceae bacterium]
MKYFALILCVLAVTASSAGSFMLGLARTLDSDESLYARNGAGREVELAETGVAGPDGAIVQDLGIPSVAQDGTVLFAAAILEKQNLRWRIFAANPESGESIPLSVPRTSAILPEMRFDPRPIAASDGAVIFGAHQAQGGDAVFKLVDGQLSSLLRTGAPTRDGRAIRALSFGTVAAANRGQVALAAYLQPGGQAELLISATGDVTVLAAEGDAAPGGGRFLSGFSPPAASESGNDPVVAFTARTSRGDALFLYSQGRARRVLSNGAACKGGRIKYLWPSRPGLMPGGTLAILASCSGTPAILLVTRGGAKVVLRAEQNTARGRPFYHVNNPMLSASGAIFFGATGADDVDRIYSISRRGTMSEIAPFQNFDRQISDPAPLAHTVSSAAIAINQHGVVAYLGGR